MEIVRLRRRLRSPSFGVWWKCGRVGVGVGSHWWEMHRACGMTMFPRMGRNDCRWLRLASIAAAGMESRDAP